MAKAKRIAEPTTPEEIRRHFWDLKKAMDNDKEMVFTPRRERDPKDFYLYDKAAIVEVLTDLAAAVNAATDSAVTQFLSAIGSRVPDARDRRRRRLYIRLTCDILHFLNID